MVKFTSWGSAALWVGAVAVASGLMLLAPSERQVMGQLPPLAAKAHDQRSVDLPRQLPADRTLALIVFGKEQKSEAHRWIDGLGLRRDASIPWLQMRVLPPQSTIPVSHHALPAGTPPERLLSVSTDAGVLAQSMALPDTGHTEVVVIDRDGQILAKAQGPFDEVKARTLLEALRSD